MTQRERLGKYEILEVLGRGAMGIVFKGFDPGIDRTVAIKTVRKELIEDDDRAGMALARFRNEARAAGRLSHPGIVAVYDYGESGDVTYIAMEYVQGNSLREYFNLGTRFGEPDLVSIMAQLLEALQHAHDAGVWHRDIKPANLIIMANGRLKIADFGIARIEASQLTQTGVVMGSPGYMAPEQYAGGTIDWRADLFATAVVMHQLLTGQRLYTGSAEQVAYKICHQEPPAPSAVDPGKGWERYDPLLQRALAKSPDLRFPSASAFREAILQAYAAPVNAAVSEETILATTTRPAGVFEPSNPSARTGDPSAGARATPTPPPLAPPPVPLVAPQAAASIAHSAPPKRARHWGLLAGGAAVAIAGAFLGGWWVSRTATHAPSAAAPRPVERVAAVSEAKSAPPKPVPSAAASAPPERARPAATPQVSPKRPPASAPRVTQAAKAETPPARSPVPVKKSKTATAGKPPGTDSPAGAPKPAPRAADTGARAPSARQAPATKPRTSSVDPRPAAIAASPPPAVDPVTPPPPTSPAGEAASPLGAPPATPVPPVVTASAAPAEAVSAKAAATQAAPAAAEKAPEPAKPPPPPPSVWRDQGITFKVASKLQFNRQLWSAGIEVQTSAGIVTLRGTVDSKELSEQAEKIAAGVYGVHGVKNELKISP